MSALRLTFRTSPPLANDDLNALFSVAWAHHADRDFTRLLRRSVGWIATFDADRLVGFVNIAGDGGIHAFLLDVTVHPSLRRRGVGTRLVGEAVQWCRGNGIRWVHVDYEPHLAAFYERACGFRSTSAGVMDLQPTAN